MDEQRSTAPSMPVDVAAKYTPEQLRDLVAEGCFSVKDAAAFSGISRSRLFELLGSGQIVSFMEGMKRVIPRREMQRYLAERLEAAQAKQRGEVP
jgi:predicted transcriptional regulator of viral defense system